MAINVKKFQVYSSHPFRRVAICKVFVLRAGQAGTHEVTVFFVYQKLTAYIARGT